MTIQRDGTRYGLVVLLLFPMVVLWGCQDAPSVLGPAGIHEPAPALSITSLEEIPEAWEEIPGEELASLLALYEATDGDNWTKNDGWLDEETPPSQWHAVTVEGGHVTSLNLINNNLSGEVPPALGNLPGLQFLSLAFNNLIGEIPGELGNLGSLQSLWLFVNQLTGQVPPELGSLENLLSLRLNINGLSGGIPPRLGNLHNLQQLHLGANQLSGGIPTELGNLEDLQDLDLSGNPLGGEIPVELANLRNLQRLGFSTNNLTGDIPPALANLEELQSLNLQNNDLSGAIPPELGTLGNLQVLALGRNKLTGQIPRELANLDNLVSLVLLQNDLSGEIPSELGTLPNLRSLSLGFNNLTGEVPAELGNLANLESLNLRVTGLSGEIPTELGNLENLRFLDLNHTDLSGPLPQTLTQLALDRFWFDNTDLCEPPDGEFQAWLASIPNLLRTGVLCSPTTTISFGNTLPEPGSHISQDLNPFAIISVKGIVKSFETSPSIRTANRLIEAFARADLELIRHQVDVCVRGSELDHDALRVFLNLEEVTDAVALQDTQVQGCDSSARVSLRKYWIDQEVTVSVIAQATDGTRESVSWSFSVETTWRWIKGAVVGVIKNLLGPIIATIEGVLMPTTVEAPSI